MSNAQRKAVEDFTQPTPGEIPRQSELKWVIRQLSHGILVNDQVFDEIYPGWVRLNSRVHWTPVKVIQRAVELLVGKGTGKILDVGSGAGKFCLIGACVSKARFFGIEQRAHLVHVSQMLVNHYQIPRVTFMNGNLMDLDWSSYDAFYLYNPFQEHRAPKQKIDGTIQVHPDYYKKYSKFTENQLACAKKGTRVVTYHGFGGNFPESYRKTTSEFHSTGFLECWEKVT